MVALLLFSYGCLVAVNVLWLFFMVPWVGLQSVMLWYFLIILTYFLGFNILIDTGTFDIQIKCQ